MKSILIYPFAALAEIGGKALGSWTSFGKVGGRAMEPHGGTLLVGSGFASRWGDVHPAAHMRSPESR